MKKQFEFKRGFRNFEIVEIQTKPERFHCRWKI